MIKCKRFWTTKEQHSHGEHIVNATTHFNNWTSDDVRIVSTQVLSHNGFCTEIIVFYEDLKEPVDEQ